MIYRKKPSARIIMAVLAAILTVSLLLGGLSALAASIVTTTIITKNSAPVAENLEFTTYRGIAISGIFAAVDPEGELITFKISSEPKKGTVEMTGDNSFTYTPADGKKGSDSFTYSAVDESRNVSAAATVSIEINKQSTDVAYSDMDGNDAYYAALALSEAGVFTGELLGSEYFFRPDESVTRGEFLAMCLQISGTESLENVTRTGFFDDDSIPLWVKPYVSTALINGIISGYENDEGRLVFSSEEPITFAEAIVILNNTLGITDVVSVSAIDSGTTPAWAYQATVNLYACDIISSGVTDVYSETVNRADAAEMLVAAMELLSSRDNEGWLFSWIN